MSGRHLRKEEVVERGARPPSVLRVELQRVAEVWGAYPGISEDLWLALRDLEARHIDEWEAVS